MDNTARRQSDVNGTGLPASPQGASAQVILEKMTRWQAAVDARLRTQMSVIEVLEEYLLVELRTHYYDGNIDPHFIGALLDTVLQRMIDQAPVAPDEEEQAPYRWPGGADRGFAVERQEVIVQVVESVASSFVGHYKDYLRRHWRMGGDDATLVERVKQRLEAHMADVDSVFQPDRLADLDVDALREKLEERQDDWGLMSESTGLATAPERERLEALARSQLPGWLRGLGEADRERLELFQDHTSRAQVLVDGVLDGLGSLRAFARQLAKDYVRHELDMEVEPDRIRVQVQWRGVMGQPVQTWSLSELLAAGPVRPDTLGVFLVENGAMLRNQALPSAFISQLLADVDAPASYWQALVDRYGRGELREALFDWFKARLQQSAFVARCAGHLKVINHEALESLWEGRGTSTLRVSGLVLPNALKCADLLLFYRQDLQGDVLLYAPGKPDGQEWIELPSLWAASVEVGAWTRSEAGREYLSQRISPVDRDVAREYFTRVANKPTTWNSSSDPRSTVTGFKACLEDNVAMGVDHHLAQVERDQSPRWYSALTRAARRNISSLSQELLVHQQVFNHRMDGYEVFVDFARRTVTQAIAPYMRSKGVQEPVDPATVLIDYHPGVANDQAKVASLLDLAIYGYDDNAGIDDPRKGVRSSVGQDLRQVRSAELASYLRRAYVGEQYVREIRARYLDARAPEYSARRLAYRNLLLTRMDRDLRVALGKSQLNADEFWWLTRQVTLLGESEPVSVPVYSGAAMQHEGVIRLTLGGHVVIGAYVFAYFEPKGVYWLYTPDAPDGVAFRRYQDFSGAVAARLHDYMLERVALGARAAVRRTLAALAAASTGVDTLREFNRVNDVQAEFDAGIERAVTDVEDVTRSRTEVIRQQVIKGLLFASAPVCLVYPPFALLLDVALIAASVKQAAESHWQGDADRALGHWLTASWGVLFAALGAGAVAALLGQATRSLKRVVTPVSLSGQRLANAPPLIARESGPVIQPIRFNPKQAVGKVPEGLELVTGESLFKGTYRSPSSASQPLNTYYLRSKGRYYQVKQDPHFDGLCLVDARRPDALYNLPIRRLGNGRWVGREVGLRGGSEQVLVLGRVSDLREAFPGHAFPDVSRGALQGEAVVARFSEAADNYLFSLNAQACVIASLYNPSTRVGAVIHFDHNIRALIERSLRDVMQRLGGTATDIRATLVGGDWLTGVDIGGRVRSVMRRQGLQPTWDHWSYSSCFGNTYGVALDLSNGVTSVFKTSRSLVERYYIPVLARAKKSADPVSLRARGFMTRLRSDPLIATPSGAVTTGQGRSATAREIEAQAFPTVVLS
ncbi:MULTISPECIES: dermonecrotic toxin domain-containing protein [Pseudomonas]|uniref:dermonecrotic toxin domain-containing protein n=1 Tax=Pseudomonas TaxID=286 RepID=UPI001BED1F56|nr:MULTISPECIES: DUF6543 domain-containing protein [Pseudomonas]MBT2339275.1 type III effector 1 [Pseudomonas fluorescens]MCD4528946.1 type III effector 1 [Pseudomonas sp. C3-2018]